MPVGRWNRAAAPVPSANPASWPKPASVDTTPSGEIARMQWYSETNAVPSGATTTELGASNVAVAAGPSRYPRLGQSEPAYLRAARTLDEAARTRPA